MTRHRFERPPGPSRAVGDAEEFHYSEKEQERPHDVMPESDPEFTSEGESESGPARGAAALRLKIEELLRRREAAPIEQWQAQGLDGLRVLVSLLDDPGLGEPLRHTVIATLGRLGPPDLAERLGPVLLDGKENALTRTYAASALGRLGGERSAAWLARAIGDPDEMVRLQLARSLQRLPTPLAVQALRSLARDHANIVAEVAQAALRGVGAWQPVERGGPSGTPGTDRQVPEESDGGRRSVSWLMLAAIVLALIGGSIAAWLLR